MDFLDGSRGRSLHWYENIKYAETRVSQWVNDSGDLGLFFAIRKLCFIIHNTSHTNSCHSKYY